MAKIKIKFYISGDGLNLNDVDNRMAIARSAIRWKNEFPVPEFGMNVWKIETTRKETTSLTSEFRDLITILKEKTQVINDFVHNHNAETSFTVVVNSPPMPPMDTDFTLENEVIQFVSSINAEISFDMYIEEADQLG